MKLFSIIFVFLLLNCSDLPTLKDRNAGEACIKTSHCKEGLVCINGICSESTNDGGTELDSFDGKN